MGKLPSFKYNIGDIFVDEKRNIKIIDREYRPIKKIKGNIYYISNRKFYKYECQCCGNQDWIIEYAIDGNKQKIGCNACGSSPKKLIHGINDITTTAPWMIPYFLGGYEEARKHFKYEKSRTDMVCPDCKRIHKNKMIETVCNNRKLTCPCQDSWSYPNKFMYAFFEKIEVEFTTEKVFDWAKEYRYDIYVEYNGLHIICEQNGIQHYEESNVFNTRRSLKDEQINDINKKCKAFKNGIDEYITIDCSISTPEYIKSSIESSNLDKIFNICYSDINWEECDKFALSNLVKVVCNYKNSHKELSLEEIANDFHMSYATILKYVKCGSKYGWCNYSKEESMKKRKYKHNHPSFKPIYCITTNDYFENTYEAEKELTKRFNIPILTQGIQKSARTGKSYKDMIFRYISWSEYECFQN